MKKNFIKVLSALLVFACTLCVAQAATTRESLRIRNADALIQVSGNTFTAYFDITGTSKMDEIGASSIVFECYDGNNWVSVKTFTPSNTTGMVGYNVKNYSGSVSYTPATSGSYRAVVTVYAKSNGTAEYRTIITQ